MVASELTHVKVVTQDLVIEPSRPYLLSYGDEVWVCDASGVSGVWLKVLGTKVTGERAEVWYELADECGTAIADVPAEAQLMHRWEVRSEAEVDENERHSRAIAAIRRPE